MKYFTVLEAVKNRRIDSLFVDLSHKLFGNIMMFCHGWTPFLAPRVPWNVL